MASKKTQAKRVAFTLKGVKVTGSQELADKLTAKPEPKTAPKTATK